MITEKMLRLSGYIIGQQNKPFEWGIRDCNTFVATVNDLLTGNKTLVNIVNKYHDLKSAIRFQKEYLTANQYLYKNGWREVNDLIRDGDVLTVEDRHFTRAHVIFCGMVWSVHEQLGVVNAPLDAMPEYKHWRLE